MKIKSFAFFSVIVALICCNKANANPLIDVYVGGMYAVGGNTLIADDTDVSKSVSSYGAVFGMDIPLFRLELEYDYIDSDKITTNLGMLNAYFKMPTPMVKPYIGAGIGMTFDGNYAYADKIDFDTDDVVAYQGMIGVTLNLPVLPFNVDVEGRVLYAPDMIDVLNNNIDMLQYDGRLKLRYVF